MSCSLVVHDTIALSASKRRASFLTCPKRPDPAPIPPTLVDSPYLSSPDSIFRRKSILQRWPSQQHDEWLRDMVPMDRSDSDSKSDSSSDSPPSPTSPDSPHGCSLFPPSSSLLPPSPMLRPRSTTPDVATPVNRASGSGSAQLPALSPIVLRRT